MADSIAEPLLRGSSAAAKAPRFADLSWVAVFGVLALLTRLHSLPKDIIDWDESTFIIVASDVLHGHLPYIHVWDNKPPVIFLTLALAMRAFGESLVTVRLLSTFLVFLLAATVYAICRRSVSPFAAGAASSTMICILAVRNFQPLMSEHLVSVLLMLSILLALARSYSLSATFAVGVLMSLTTLTRMNIAVVAAAMGVYYASAFVWRRQSPHPLSVLAYVAGGAVPILAFSALYWHAGALGLFFTSVFVVPFSYASEQMSVSDAVLLHVTRWRELADQSPLAFGIYTALLVAACGLVCLRLADACRSACSGRKASQSTNDLLLIPLLAAATAISVLASGAAYPHYWIQLFPFAAIFMAQLMSVRRVWLVGSLSRALAIIFVAVGLWQTASASVRMLNNWADLEKMRGLRSVAAEINREMGANDTFYALTDNLLYWYLDRVPPSPILTHPTNIVTDTIMRPLVKIGYLHADEFERILASRPMFIYKEQGDVWYLAGRPEGARFAAVLKERYTLWRSERSREIYRLRDDTAGKPSSDSK